MNTSDPECGPPPTKKSRVGPDGNTLSGEENSPAFYLDTFPKEVLDNVLRYFSYLPELRDWVSHVPLESIIELYGVNGELGRFMKPRFNALCISDSFKAADDIEEYNWEKRKGPMLWTDDLDVARRFVLAGGGQALHTIIVGSGKYSEDNGNNIVGDFQSNCPNVKSLSIADENDENEVWVSGFGCQLEKLELVTEESCLNFMNCTNLRELNLKLRRDDFAWSELWDILGDGLEVLTLHGPRYEDDEDVEFGKIKTNCPNLRRINIYGVLEHNQELAALLASYGDQLEYCHVEDMAESELATITSVCKNVRFSAMVTFIHEMYPTFKVLGDKLDKIICSPVYGDGDFLYDDLTNALNGCINIRYLDIRCCCIELMTAIMATPKQHLKALHVGSLFELEDKEVKTIMDVASRGTVAVEEFHYHDRAISGDALDKFLTRNKSSLSSVTLEFSNEISYEKLDTIFPLLLKCQDLEVVSMTKFTPNMPQSLKRRGIQCLVGVFRTPLY